MLFKKARYDSCLQFGPDTEEVRKEHGDREDDRWMWVRKKRDARM